MLSALLAGCSADHAAGPSLIDAGATSPYAQLAFTATIDVQRRVVSVAPPARNGVTAAVSGTDRPQLSILGADAVRLVPTNIRVSAPGAFAPNKVRVTFDVAIENRFTTLALITPTWPEPPAPAVILFPLDYTVTRSPGGVVGSDGNTVEVSAPSFGSVTPSPDWNGTGDAGSGAPYNFITEQPCGALSTRDCVRWVAFGVMIRPGDPRVTRTVGFDIDAAVQQVRSRMLVAADLVAAATPAP